MRLSEENTAALERTCGSRERTRRLSEENMRLSEENMAALWREHGGSRKRTCGSRERTRRLSREHAALGREHAAPGREHCWLSSLGLRTKVPETLLGKPNMCIVYPNTYAIFARIWKPNSFQFRRKTTSKRDDFPQPKSMAAGKTA